MSTTSSSDTSDTGDVRVIEKRAESAGAENLGQEGDAIASAAGAAGAAVSVDWIDPLAVWSWNSLKYTTCSICRIDLNDIAIVASDSNTTYEHADAFTDVFVGGCGHTFHRVCI